MIVSLCLMRRHDATWYVAVLITDSVTPSEQFELEDAVKASSRGSSSTARQEFEDDDDGLNGIKLYDKDGLIYDYNNGACVYVCV